MAGKFSAVAAFVIVAIASKTAAAKRSVRQLRQRRCDATDRGAFRKLLGMILGNT
jgi:hypothetical protein